MLLGLGLVLVQSGACAPRWVTAVTVSAIPESNDTFRIDVGLTATRKYPDCRILTDTARAQVDGMEMRSLGRGAPYRGTTISGVELPPPKACSDFAGFTTFAPLPSVPDGTPTKITVEDGPHRLEIVVMNARARYRTELVGSPDVVGGDAVTLQVTPASDPPLQAVEVGEIGLYTPKARISVVSGKDIQVSGRRASFRVPSLPPGEYKVVYSIDPPPLRIVRCTGASTCKAGRMLSPDSDIVLKVR